MRIAMSAAWAGRYIAAGIDENQVIYFDMGTRAVGLREGEIELSKPFRIASRTATAGLRKLECRLLKPHSGAPP